MSGSADENLRLWDVRQSQCLRIMAAHSDPLTSVNFSRDGTVIVSGSHDGLIRLWDTGTGQCLKTLVGEAKAPVVNARFTPNDKYLVATASDGSGTMWEVVSDRIVKRYVMESCGYARSMEFFQVEGKGPSETYLIQGDGLKDIGVWNVQRKMRVSSLSGHTDIVLGLSFSPETNRLASASLDGTTIVWECTESL